MSFISAGNTTTTTLVVNGDTTGNLVFNTGGANTTALTITNAQNATFAGTLTTASQGIAFASLPTGSVLQVVQTTYSTSILTTSTSYVTTGLNGTITPKFATSKILILVHGCTYTNAAGTFGTYTIFRGTVSGTNLATNGFNILGATSSDLQAVSAMSYLDSPATTSATTYTVGMKVAAGSQAYWAAGNTLTAITLMEIAA